MSWYLLIFVQRAAPDLVMFFICLGGSVEDPACPRQHLERQGSYTMAEDSIPSIPQWGPAGSKEGNCSVKERSLLLGTQCRGR